MNKQNSTKYSHLDIYERVRIQEMLDRRCSISDIARELHKSPSTIQREINRNVKIQDRSGNDCLIKKQCQLRTACKAECNHKLCKHCKSVKCYEGCTDYIKPLCDRLQETPYLCNGCDKYYRCPMEKRIYRAPDAERTCKERQKEKSDGFNLTREQVERTDRLISPLIKNGMSPHAALQAVKDRVPVSEATLYRMIDARLISARNIDLPEKVSRRPSKLRKRKNKDVYAVLSAQKKGRMYEDYLNYVTEHGVFTVEMDCVIGKKTDKAAIMSLHWKNSHMQLYFMLGVHGSAHVVEMLDRIECSLESLELFRECFPLILTDNGEEFTDIVGMERSCLIPGERRTHIFFCEPNRSDQKGSAERNHRLLRRIIPKGTSVEPFWQMDMSRVNDHVNSYIRKDLGDVCPYHLAAKLLPKDFFLLLGLEQIAPDQIILKPSLISKKEKPLAQIA